MAEHRNPVLKMMQMMNALLRSDTWQKSVSVTLSELGSEHFFTYRIIGAPIPNPVSSVSFNHSRMDPKAKPLNPVCAYRKESQAQVQVPHIKSFSLS